MTADAIRIVVADDHPVVLRGTVQMIGECCEDFVVAATARDGDEAFDVAMRHKPAVLVLDVQMPKRDGIAVVKSLRQCGATFGILMLSSAHEESAILRALQAGANGYLLKTATEDELCRGIRLVAQGGAALLQPEVQQAVVASYQRPAAPVPAERLVEALSDRELEILKTLAQDLTNKEIGLRLGISDRTVQQHLANITGKLGVASRTGAVLKALQQGWLTLEDLRI